MSFALTAGCGAKQNQPLVASSAEEASYAARYPDALDSAVQDFDKREGEAKQILTEVPNYSDQLHEPDWGHVLEVVDAAVEAGRSQAYADQMEEMRHVNTFFEEEKNEISQRAGGAVQYAAQQGGCDVQVGGAVGPAVDKAVEKQLEERLRERNEAHLLILRYSESLGTQNANTLTEQADHLSYLSYITHVELTETKLRVEALIEEADQVEKTADAFIEDEEAFQKGEKRTDKEKNASAARISTMNESRSKVAATAQKAKESAEQMEQRIKKLQEEFDYIIGAYRSELQQKGEPS